ncbi:MAG: UDP-N-acetylmuramoylalanine--D-glutamate ligase [Coxiella sp. RIFCSPHIGHO2_12_FULL_42_15]|nr:MAG: UDP-N-acetylmuramoylalanine--D-glutamate ligase [Coxiella sp. RIFCSPHIGHO2_12_FULL_42_15]
MKVVVGLGATGLSCVDYLLRQGHEVVAMDSASAPAGYLNLKNKHPGVTCILGDINFSVLSQAEEIIISPGVPVEKVTVPTKNIPIVGDVELFARVIEHPVYAITGSNGKTTVTTLVGEMAHAANRKAAVAGNIGTPVLDFMLADQYDLYVLELSSFQLETTYSLKPRAATILNVTPDHLDRYRDMNEYLRAKQRIYHECEYPIVNADEAWMWQSLSLSKNKITFSLQQQNTDYGLEKIGNRIYLRRRGERLLDVADMRLQGLHHWQNALAALAFGEVMQLPDDLMLNVICNFSGLVHRCQWVRNKNGVDWYNDSKATNVGATETAIKSLGNQLQGKLILLAGGLGKGADFSVLKPCVQHYVSDVILFGQDAFKIAQALQAVTNLHHVNSLQEAVWLADRLAKAQDKVVLAPACASFDMFANYMDRGEQFIKAVEAL